MVNVVYLALGLLWSLNASSYIHCDSSSIFVPRSITHDATYELALSNYDFYHPRYTNKMINVYLTPLYQQSFHAKNVIPYMMYPDIVCEYFSGDTIDLKRSVYGMHIALFANLSQYCENMWGAIEFAPIGATQQLCLNNAAIPTGESSPTRVGACEMKAAGVDDIQLKLGWNHFSRDNEEHIGGYAVLSIPTGTNDDRMYALQPQIGTHNPALGVGMNGDAIILMRPEYDLHFMADVKYRYLFGAHECRSLIAPRQNDPLIRVASDFIHEVKVTPRGQLELWSALHYAYLYMHFEMGWNLWVRQSEKEQFNDQASHWTTNFSVPSLGCPTTITNKVYAALAYDSYIYSVPIFVGLGASVELSNKPNVCDYWAVWGKIGFEF